MLGVLVAAILVADGGVDAGVRVDAGVALGPCRTTQDICFSPDGQCDLRVVALIDRTKAGGTLDIFIYSLNRAVIVDAILRAKARGATVRMLLDRDQITDPKEMFQLQRLLAADIPLRRDTHQGYMHMKVVVVDNKEFATGSFNFSNNASENNDENLLVWDCPKNAMVYEQRFEKLWPKFKDATDMILPPPDAGVDAGK